MEEDYILSKIKIELKAHKINYQKTKKKYSKNALFFFLYI